MTDNGSRPFAGMTALVTGSTGSGIGRSTALRLARGGAKVVLNYGTAGKDDERSRHIERIQRTIESLGTTSAVVRADTRDAEAAKRLADEAISAFGAVDILVNNAGAPWLEQEFAETTPERWAETLAAEIMGPSLLIGALLPAMRERRFGRIVNIIIDFETLGHLIDRQYGHRLEAFPYAFYIGKLGRQAIAPKLAHAELKYGITINNILPGIIEEMPASDAEAAVLAPAIAASPLVTPAHVAEVVSELCGPAFRHVTGSDIVMPGNLYSRIR